MSEEPPRWTPVTKATVQLWAIEQRRHERRSVRRAKSPLRRAGGVLRALGALLRIPPGH